jgi:hypothetical protein
MTYSGILVSAQISVMSPSPSDLKCDAANAGAKTDGERLDLSRAAEDAGHDRPG